MSSISERLSPKKLDGSAERLALQGPTAASSAAPAPAFGQKQDHPTGNGGIDLWHVKNRIQARLVGQLNLGRDASDSPEVHRQIERLFDELLNEEGILLGRTERARLFETVVADILGFGPIEFLLGDDSISEVMVNGPDLVYIERNGMLEETNVRFADEEHLRRIIERIIGPLGRRCDESSPMVDARLPDGSRVNVIIPPLSLTGPIVTIRKFSRNPLTVKDLVSYGSLTQQMADFLGACVRGRLNIVVSGGTGSGKTTLLNVLSQAIPDNERIVTIEDAAELRLRQRHVVQLEKRPPNVEGKGEVSIRQLVVNALRMRPDRIVVGECRGQEALDMLQAMNTGHDGSLTTVHSNGPRDTLSRLETMVLMSGVELSMRAVREQVVSAVDMIVHMDRMVDGSRRITKVCEVQGMENETVVLQDIFDFRHSGVEGGKVVGQHVPIARPKFLWKLERRNVRVPLSIFSPDQMVMT